MFLFLYDNVFVRHMCCLSLKKKEKKGGKKSMKLFSFLFRLSFIYLFIVTKLEEEINKNKIKIK